MSNFESGFDAPPRVPHRLADNATHKWVTVTKRDKAGRALSSEIAIGCNQEPTYEELMVQRRRGVAPPDLRNSALEARRAINNGFLPLPESAVREAVIKQASP